MSINSEFYSEHFDKFSQYFGFIPIPKNGVNLHAWMKTTAFLFVFLPLREHVNWFTQMSSVFVLVAILVKEENIQS